MSIIFGLMFYGFMIGATWIIGEHMADIDDDHPGLYLAALCWPMGIPALLPFIWRHGVEEGERKARNELQNRLREERQIAYENQQRELRKALARSVDVT